MSAATVLLAAGCAPKAKGAPETGVVPSPSSDSGLVGTVDTSAGETGAPSTGPDDGRPNCTTADVVDISDCCATLSKWCSEAYTDREAADACHFGPDYDGSTGCIPWGPPAPPARRVA